MMANDDGDGGEQGLSLCWLCFTIRLLRREPAEGEEGGGGEGLVAQAALVQSNSNDASSTTSSAGEDRNTKKRTQTSMRISNPYGPAREGGIGVLRTTEPAAWKGTNERTNE